MGLSYSAWKLSVLSMHLVFCRMLCVRNMLSNIPWHGLQTKAGMGWLIIFSTQV